MIRPKKNVLSPTSDTKFFAIPGFPFDFDFSKTDTYIYRSCQCHESKELHIKNNTKVN